MAVAMQAVNTGNRRVMTFRVESSPLWTRTATEGVVEVEAEVEVEVVEELEVVVEMREVSAGESAGW
jgi:hypothetical protein